MGCGRSDRSSGSRWHNGLRRGRWSHHGLARCCLNVRNGTRQRVEVQTKVMQLLQVQPCGHVRRLDCGRRLHGRGRRLLHLFFSGRFTIGTEVRPNFVCEVVIECTGVRFLIWNAKFRQILQNHIALHFQFTCQFVDPNLPHA